MRKPLLVLSLISSLSFSYGQSFQFVDAATGTAAPSYYVRNAADTLGDEFVLNGVNLSSATKNVKVRMTVLSTPSGCTNDIFFCDPIACYPASVTLSIASFPMGANDTSTGVLIPHMSPGFCCGDYIVNYCLFDVANPSDSANILVYYSVSGNHCTNGIGDLAAENISLKVFPNPVSETCSVSWQLNPGHHEASLILRNVAGEIVKQYPVENNSSYLRIDLADLSGGVYFCSLVTPEKNTVSKKLIVIK